MRRMSDEDAELIFRQLRKCSSDEEFRGLISSLRDGNIVKPESYDDYIKHESVLKHLQDNTVNILLTGPVGTGKSATVNAILKKDAAVVGRGLCPATTDIKSYSMVILSYGIHRGLVMTDRVIKKYLIILLIC